MKQIIKVFTDGGARGNPGPAAAGVAIESFAGKERLLCGKYLGTTTNNIAEYSAFLLAFETLLSQKEINPAETNLQFYADSLLAVKQLNGEFKVKNSAIANIIEQIKVKESLFAGVSYQHIPREKNTFADNQVNKILDLEVGAKY